MDLYNLILTAKIQKGEGGGGDIDVDALTVTENGTYTASSGHAFSPVSVNVPIPSGYIQPTGTSSITENGIYNISSFASVDVNVSGGGGITVDDIAMQTISGYMSGTASIIESYAFYGNAQITGASFPNATVVGAYAFNSCNGISDVYFPNIQSAYDSAFYSLGISEAIFPELKTMSQYAFGYCNKMQMASFPKLTSIGYGAFYYCTKLESLYLLGSTVATLANNAFSNTPMSNSAYLGHFGSVYVPASLVASYKTATRWSSYSNRITSYVE